MRKARKVKLFASPEMRLVKHSDKSDLIRGSRGHH